MNKKVDAIICDLDGTLCNVDHRRHFVQGEKQDWKSFHESLVTDKLNKWCATILVALHGHRIILVTGRPEEYRVKTERWLVDNSVYFNELYMRDNGDFRKDEIVKKEIYDKNIKAKYDILFCVDDRKQVVDMWRNQGLICLQCDKGDF